MTQQNKPNHSKGTTKDSKNKQKFSKDKLNKTKIAPTPSNAESYNSLPEKSASHHDKFF